MKKKYRFENDDWFEADYDELHRLLAENQQYLTNYEEVFSSLEDDEYVARGNGFCDRKYSDNFVESQIDKYAHRIEQIEGWLAEWPLVALKEGNVRFVMGKSTRKEDYSADRERFALGQRPFAVVLCCSDSRVPAEILFDQGLGDLFVIRNAGNVVDEDVLGSVEYAVEHLHTKLVVVLGHSNCGAVTATHQGGELPGHIKSIAERIRPSLQSACCIDDNARRHAQRMAQLIAENEIVKHEKTQVLAAFYDVRSGVVDWMCNLYGDRSDDLNS